MAMGRYRHNVRAADEKLTRQKRLMMSPREERELEELVFKLAGELQTTVRMSHVLRACIHVLRHAEPQIINRAKSTNLTRPPNEHADVLGDFEARLARMFLVAFKESARF